MGAAVLLAPIHLSAESFTVPSSLVSHDDPSRPIAVRLFLLLRGPRRDVWSAEPQRPQVVGHRGLLHAAPKNTLAGFMACLELRVGFEFDVRRSKDGELVSLHDATVDRTTGAKGPLAELLSADLFRLDAGGWFGRSFRGERVPRVAKTLSQLEKRGSEATLIAVDLKETGDGIEEALIRQADRHHVLDRLVFIGETIESNEVRGRLWAASPKAQLARLAPAADKIGEVIDDRHADWVYVRFLPSPESVGQVHRAGKRLFLAAPLVAGEMRENWTRSPGGGIGRRLQQRWQVAGDGRIGSSGQNMERA